MRISLKVLAVLGTVATATGLLVRNDEPPDMRPCLTPGLELATTVSTATGAAPTGRVLVANQFSGTASLVDLGTGSVTTLDVEGDPHDAVISPDGRWGVVSDFGEHRADGFSGHTLSIVDVSAGRIVRRIDTRELRGLHDLEFRPGAPTRVIVTAQTSRRVLEVDVVTGEIVAAVDTRGDRSHTVALSPDGRWAYTTNEGSGTISRLDLTTRTFAAPFDASENVEGIATDASGREVWTGEQARGIVTVRDGVSGALLASLPGFRNPVRLVRSPDGGRMMISDPGCKVLVVADPAARRVTRVIGTSALGPALAGGFAGQGHLALVSLMDERALAVIDLDAGAMISRHRVGRHPDGLGWGPAAR